MQIKISTTRIETGTTTTDIGGIKIDTESTTTMTIAAATDLRSMTATNFGAGTAENYRHLPPGLAKRDRLPPGLERQLVLRGTFPPGLESRVVVVPVDLDRRLPPPPPDCERVAIGGHIVLRNRNTKIILDIFHFE